MSRIPAVPTILEVVCRTTGMRFAAVARVTEERWIACSVMDEIQFGLAPGGELDVASTICHEIRLSREPVVIDHVAEDGMWRRHHTPAKYGFQSYISVPVLLEDGSFFGTLCAIDPSPARLNTPETIGMFRLFAELIGRNIDVSRKLAQAEARLVEERAVAELREQFIAVLGHDLRTPMRAIACFVDLLARKTPEDGETRVLTRTILDSSARMVALIDNLMDFARGRLGGGLILERDASKPLEPVLRGVITELNASYPDRSVETQFGIAEPIDCDRARIAQLFSNLLGNALAHGSANHPVTVRGACAAGMFELSVANAGPPISSHAIQHLFQPFYRSAESGNREGLGLGLYIAHEIATAHDGTLSVRSDELETRFTFRMPLR